MKLHKAVFALLFVSIVGPVRDLVEDAISEHFNQYLTHKIAS